MFLHREIDGGGGGGKPPPGQPEGGGAIKGPLLPTQTDGHLVKVTVNGSRAYRLYSALYQSQTQHFPHRSVKVLQNDPRVQSLPGVIYQ